MVKDKITFLSAWKTAGSGIAYTVINPNPLTVLDLSLTCAGGSAVVNFEALGTSGSTYTGASCVKMLDGTSASWASGVLDGIWTVPLYAFEKFRCNVLLSSGSLNIVGKVIQ